MRLEMSNVTVEIAMASILLTNTEGLQLYRL